MLLIILGRVRLRWAWSKHHNSIILILHTTGICHCSEHALQVASLEASGLCYEQPGQCRAV